MRGGGAVEIKDKAKRFRELLKEESLRKYIAVLCIFLVISLLIEIFIFNYRCIESVFNDEIAVEDLRIVSGADESGDNYRATGSSAEFEIRGILGDDSDIEVKNMFLDISLSNDEVAKVAVSIRDEANASYFSSPAQDVLEDIEASKYFRIHSGGNTHGLRFEVETTSGAEIRIDGCALNARVPMLISPVRFLLLALLLWILYILRPKSSVYKYKINFKSKKQKALIIVLVIAQLAAFYNIVNLNPFFKDPTKHYYDQYHELTESLLAGHTYLIQHEVSDELKALDNPYDLNQRYSELSKGNGGNAWDYEWDHAYYNEKIYVYFGVAPVILMYIPYYLVTGGDQLPDHMAIFIISVLLVISVLLLLWEIIKKWFKNTPLALYLLMSCLFINSCGIVYALQRPDLYSVPVVMSMTFGILGLAFWIGSLKDNPDGTTSISIPKITLGALCVAITSGCRPQTLIIIGLGVILYWRSVFKDRTLFSKSGWKQTVGLMTPFIVIGALIMAYNFARFGSPFDFGANYNLTSNDMRQRGFEFDRSFLGIFHYFFAPVLIDTNFPFISTTPIDTVYIGKSILEPTYGIFMSNPVLWIVFFVVAQRKYLKQKGGALFGFSIAALIMSVILAVLAAQVAAIYLRYITDFSWLVFIVACIMVFAIYERLSEGSKDVEPETSAAGAKNKLINAGGAALFTQSGAGAVRRLFVLGVLTAFVLGMIFHGLWIFTDISDNLCDLNPSFYYFWKYLICFWI